MTYYRTTLVVYSRPGIARNRNTPSGDNADVVPTGTVMVMITHGSLIFLWV